MAEEPKLDEATINHVIEVLKEFHSKINNGEKSLDRVIYFEGVFDSMLKVK